MRFGAERVLDQIKLEAPFVSGMTIWEFTSYMDPHGCSSRNRADCARLYHDYLKYIGKSRPMKTDDGDHAFRLQSNEEGVEGAATRPVPKHARNMTVYALRPRQVEGLIDKDTADVAGSIFFWMKDRVLSYQRCRIRSTKIYIVY